MFVVLALAADAQRSVAPFPMNEERHRSLLEKLVANARAIISYQVGLPLGCAKMSKILYWLEPFEKLDFPAFKQYAAATLEIPTGSERLHCTREALRRYDQKLVAINLEYREEVLDTCFEIIERFANRKENPES